MANSPRKRRVIYVLSGYTDRAIPFEWIAESSIGTDFELSFVILNEERRSSLQSNLEATGCPAHYVPCAGKKDLPRAVLQLTRLFRRLRPDVVHTHLTNANLAGLPAAMIAGVPRRVYTRHHTTLNHQYYRHAVAYDRTANALATDIVATCENGRAVLKQYEGVSDSKIRLINIGFKLEHFVDVPEERVAALRQKHRIGAHRPVIGLVSKYIEWKGIQYAIPAFKEVIKAHPGALLVLANARRSAFGNVLGELLGELPPDSYREIVFEEDAAALYKLFDVFVHLPVDPEVEAFGQVYVEALAAGVPCVWTISGIARELAKDGQNCLVAPYKDAAATARLILRLLEEPELGRRLAQAGCREVRERFGFEQMVTQLTRLYEA